MNYAIIEKGFVVNAVVSEANYAATQGWVELPEGAGIGWGYKNGEFIAPPAPVAEPASIPAPTKEELLAQLQALQAQITALGE